MGSSSRDHFSDSIDLNFDQMLDQFLDQSFENLLSGYDDQQESKKSRKKRIFIERNREEGHTRLWNDYFSAEPTYHHALFRRRFRMNKPLFLKIVAGLSGAFKFFQQNEDATGRPGFSDIQKCAAAIRLLAYGYAADAVDEYLRMADTTTRQCLMEFVEGIICLYGNEYLRRPTADDLQRLLDNGEQRGFPGMIGSIDCMEWKNCPTAWKGQYSRGSAKPTIVLEAVASYDLWIWHAFFGLPGTLNDLNVLDRSPVFDDIINGVAPQVHFSVNGHEYGLAYYLTDGIYPNWSTFIQSIKLPKGPKAKQFAKRQEGVRKDVERAFGVLQARFAIVKNPILLWEKAKIGKIMRACVILHNMIVEDERDTYRYRDYMAEFRQGEGSAHVDARVHRRHTNLEEILNARTRVRDRKVQQQLKKNLVEHIWQRHVNGQDVDVEDDYDDEDEVNDEDDI